MGSLKQILDMRQELLAGIKPRLRRVAYHWNQKIIDGLVPREIALKGNIDFLEHYRQNEALAAFETRMFQKLLAMSWPRKPEIVYYFGIGTAGALKRVAGIANLADMEVIAYDISEVAVTAAAEEFEKLVYAANASYQTDIEFACQERYVDPARPGFILLPRILDVLDNVAQDSEKMRRTAIRIGQLLGSLSVLIIHPEPEGNESAMFQDTTLYPLELVAAYIEQGAKRPVTLTRLDTIRYHGHLYTAALIQTAEAGEGKRE